MGALFSTTIGLPGDVVVCVVSGVIRFFMASKKKAVGLFFSFDSFDMQNLLPCSDLKQLAKHISGCVRLSTIYAKTGTENVNDHRGNMLTGSQN